MNCGVWRASRDSSPLGKWFRRPAVTQYLRSLPLYAFQNERSLIDRFAFRHNLRLPTASAHAQARGVRPDLLVLSQ